jgi:hypothetical protein
MIQIQIRAAGRSVFILVQHHNIHTGTQHIMMKIDVMMIRLMDSSSEAFLWAPVSVSLLTRYSILVRS